MGKAFRILGFIATALAVPLSTPASAAIFTTADLESLGSSKGNEAKSEDLVASVNMATRNEQGNLVSVTWSIENTGVDPVVLVWMYDQSYSYSGPFFSGVTAVNQNEVTKYHPVMDGAGNCLCAGNTTNSFDQSVDPAETNTYWSLFSVPNDTDSITLEIPRFEPIEDIPIS